MRGDDDEQRQTPPLRVAAAEWSAIALERDRAERPEPDHDPLPSTRDSLSGGSIIALPCHPATLN
jgi:hypothetical protein